MNESQKDFLDEYTRTLLVDWAEMSLRDESSLFFLKDKNHEIYLTHARSQGWVSSREMTVLAKGFKTAASYLRR